MQKVAAVCFDLDGVLIRGNSWYTLNTALGVTPEEDERLFMQYRAGELLYDQWIQELNVLYAKYGRATKNNIDAAVSHYELAFGAEEAVSTLHSQGIQTMIITGAFREVAEHVAKRLGIERAYGCASFVFDNDTFRVEHHGDEAPAKLEILKRACAEMDIPLSACVCVGDGGNNIELFRTTGKGIALRGSSMEKCAWCVVDSLDEVPGCVGDNH